MSISKNIDTNIAFYLVCITFIVFSATLFGDFSFIDDPVYVLRNPFVTNFKLIDIFSQSYFAAYIPVTLLSYCFDYLFFKDDPFGYHLTNIVFHALNCGLIYFLTLKLTKNRLVSFFTALIFSVHPVQTQTVAWISERKNVLSLFFMLLSLRSYINFKESGKPISYVYCLTLFILSILSKPVVVLFFALLICYDIFILRERSKVTLYDKAPFVIVSSILTYITINAQARMGAVKMYHGGSFYSNLITIPKAVTHYFKTLIYPNELLFYYDIKPAQSVLSLLPLLGIALISLLLFATLKYRKKNGTVSFGISIFFIFLLPVINIIPIEVIAADRYLYIPIFGLLLALFSFIDKSLTDYKKPIYIAMIFVSILFSYLTVKNSFSWMTREGIWEDIHKSSPDNMRAINNLVELYTTSGKDNKALDLIDEGLKVDPNNSRLLKNFALLKKIADHEEEALKLLETALINDPYDLEITLEMAKIYYGRSDYDKALSVLKDISSAAYEFPLDTEIKYRYVLANIYVKKIMFNEALVQFKAIEGVSDDYFAVSKKYRLLSEHIDQFNSNLDRFITSKEKSEYRKNLREIFKKLHLQEEGNAYLKSLEK